jgi:hypothetical protein
MTPVPPSLARGSAKPQPTWPPSGPMDPNRLIRWPSARIQALWTLRIRRCATHAHICWHAPISVLKPETSSPTLIHLSPRPLRRLPCLHALASPRNQLLQNMMPQCPGGASAAMISKFTSRLVSPVSAIASDTSLLAKRGRWPATGY